MHKIDKILKAQHVQVLVVSFTPPQRMRAFLGKHPLPYPTVADPDRAGYQAFALGRTSVLGLVRPRVLWGYIQQMLKGWRPLKPVDDDLMQLGGDFLLDARGKLAWTYGSREATDRPNADQLRAAIESL